ncbi:hypothetical protein EUTSA_v10027482mg [Eutrema salsugineum]|uniref:Neprosin PEP catalytic domain-containing protein n=1 Tax=Eutrema salsugineum TaxID=72664 RepID=V4P8W3_EUTSA|nr:hypothetical protein EUTSA_v10027482mg [Eutrema salsugineum]
MLTFTYYFIITGHSKWHYNAAEIGFWPWHKFRESFGNYVEWGGEVKFDAYIKRISILDGNFQFDRQVKHLEEFSDHTRGYDVRGLLQSGIDDAGHVIYYGGPGKI